MASAFSPTVSMSQHHCHPQQRLTAEVLSAQHPSHVISSVCPEHLAVFAPTQCVHQLPWGHLKPLGWELLHFGPNVKNLRQHAA